VLHKLDLAAHLGQLIEEQNLMDIPAGEPIRAGDEHPLKGGKSRMIAQPIEAWPAERGTAIALIAVNMGIGKLPIGMGGDVSL
jgi:hypothetical protein